MCVCVCVCVSEGKFQPGGYKVWLRIISDHFKAGPSSAFLYDSRPQLHFSLRAHYSGRCPIVPSFAGLFMSIPKTQHQNMQGGGGQGGGGQGGGGGGGG